MLKNRLIVVLFAMVALALIGSVHSGAIEDAYGGPIDAADGQVAEPSQLALIIDLFTTALREIGHALGLKHSTSKASFMYPNAVADLLGIPQTDAKQIQWKFNGKQGLDQQPRFCDVPKYDAVFSEEDKLYVIAGKYYYEPLSPSADGKGKLIKGKWPKAPDTIDAVYWDSRNGTHHYGTYMYSGDKYWKFWYSVFLFSTMIDSYFYYGFPRNLDALMSVKNKYVYAFKHGHFWRYNNDRRRVDHSGEVADFGISSDIDAANYDASQNKAYFYKNNHTYVYDFDTKKTTQTENVWMRC